jgi:hypothetical protein
VKYVDCFLAVLIVSFSLPSSGAFIPSDARSRSLALANVALTANATGFSNPAALSFLERPGLSLQVENPWLVPELNVASFSFCLPVRPGTFALTCSRYGYEAFHESQAGLSFGKSLGKLIKAGIHLDFSRIKQYAGYGSLYAIIPSLGIQVIPVQGIVLGLQVSNPAGQDYHPHGYRKIPTLVKAGMAYQPDDDILFCFEMQTQSECKPVYCGGIEYNFENQFTIRLGISSSRFTQYSLGIGYLGRHLKTDIAVSHHPVLGFSPVIMLTCFF